MITNSCGIFSNPFSSLSEEVNGVQKETNDFFSKLPSSNLSEILPYYEKESSKALVEYSVLLMALIQTIEALESGAIYKFDALVCENLCQIRALVNCINFTDCRGSLLKIKTQVQLILEKVKKLLDSSLQKTFDLKTFLEKENLNVHLSASEIFFVQCFLLTIVKKQSGNVDHPETTELLLLQSLAPEIKWAKSITYRFRNSLVNKVRGEVSRISAPFLRYLACEYVDQLSFEMLTQKNIILINGRECPPTYWTTKVLELAIRQLRIPIILWIKQKNELHKLIKEFCIYYQSNSTKTEYKKKYPHLIEAGKPVIVVQANCYRKKGILPDKEISFSEMKQYHVDELLLAYGASHRQYPNANEDIPFESSLDTTYHHFKKKAIEWKCTRDDPRLLHICHIYCDQLGNIKPIKYEINSYLEAIYGDFYRAIEGAKLNELAKEINLNVRIEGKKLVVYTKEKDISFLLEGKRSDFRPFLHQIPRVVDLTSIDYANRLELKINWKGFDPLTLAKHHPNPVKFLIDHEFYWEDISKVISYLTDEPRNFEEPAVMNLLSDLLNSIFDGSRFSHEENNPVFEIIIKGISKALDIPELKERAIDILLVASSRYGHLDEIMIEEATYYPLIYIRTFARIALKKIIYEDDRFKAIFMEMVKNEPIFRLKIELINMFDQRIYDYSDQLKNDMLVKNLSLTWKIWHLTKDDKNKKIRQNAVKDLLELIQSDAHENSLRIAAIRYLCNYFSSMDSLERDLTRFVSEYYGCHPPICPVYRLSLFLGEQQNYRLKILQFLKDIIHSEAINQEIRLEANFLLLMIYSFLLHSSTPSFLPEEIYEEIGLEAIRLRDWILAVLQELAVLPKESSNRQVNENSSSK